MRVSVARAPALLLWFLFASLTPAATRAADGPRDAYSMYLIGGYARVDVADVDTRFRAAGYPEFPRDMPAFGVGMLGGSRWVIAVDFVGLVSAEKEVQLPRGRHQVSHGAYSVLVSAGRRVVQDAHLSLYPLAGIGFGALSTEIVPLDAVDFDSVLVQTGGKATLEEMMGVAEIGAGFEYAFGEPAGSNEPRRVVLGLRAGYSFAFGRSGWRQDTIDVRGGPDGSLKGPFVRLALGLGN